MYIQIPATLSMVFKLYFTLLHRRVAVWTTRVETFCCHFHTAHVTCSQVRVFRVVFPGEKVTAGCPYQLMFIRVKFSWSHDFTPFYVVMT
jgi:hypothetical protein